MRVLLWIVAIVVGLPLLAIAFFIAWLFIYIPLEHAWNVWRMDAKNDRVWEEENARVITVEIEMGTTEGVETIQSDIICYRGYFARPQGLKNEQGAGQATMSIGYDAILTDFPTGAVLDVDLRHPCGDAFELMPDQLPRDLELTEMSVVAPELFRYCSFHHIHALDDHFFHTDAAWVNVPRIVAVQELPLRRLVSRSEMGSSEVSLMSPFAQRWGLSMPQSNYREEDGCWAGGCDGAMTRYCGTNWRKPS